MSISDLENDFIYIFNTISPDFRRFDVFNDFVCMTAFSLYNVIAKDNDIEEEFKTIRNKYSDEDFKKHVTLFNIVIDAFELKPHDFLGNIYILLSLNEECKAQFFTPFSVCKLISDLYDIKSFTDEVDKKGYIKITEPACGTGGMIIAFCEALSQKGYNPQKQLYVECVDIDNIVAMMCFIQLSIMGIPARVIVGNSLTNNFRRVFHTFFHYKDMWDEKFDIVNSIEEFRTLFNLFVDTKINKFEKNESTLKVNEIKATKSSIIFDKDSQISLL